MLVCFFKNFPKDFLKKNKKISLKNVVYNTYLCVYMYVISNL